MTVNTTTITSGPYTATGGQTIFDYTFRADVESDLDVYVNGILRTNYTVSGLGNDAGGQIEFNSGLTVNDEVYIRSSREATQDTEFSSQGGFYPEEHERAFDKLTYLIQQLADKIKRTLRIGDENTTGEIDPVDLVAGKFLQVNATGDGFQMAERPVEQVLHDGVINTIADIPFAEMVDGGVYYLKEYYANTGVGGGEFRCHAGSTTADNCITFNGPTGFYIERINYTTLTIEMAGGLDDGIVDNKAPHEVVRGHGGPVLMLGDGTYHFSAPPTLPSTATTILNGLATLSGVTAAQLNAQIIKDGQWCGVPFAQAIRDKKIGIVCGTIRAHQPQSVTSITRSGSTATVTHVAHGYSTGMTVVIAGANETGYNTAGSSPTTITVVDPDTYTYTVSGTPASPATGTITSRNPAWWFYINDSDHTPVGMTTTGIYNPITGSSTLLTIGMDDTYTKVLSVVCCPDETLAAAQGMSIGPSVALNGIAFRASCDRTFAYEIFYDTGTAQWSFASSSGQDLLESYTYATGNLVINHKYCPKVNVHLTPYSRLGAVTPYIPVLKQVTNTQFTVNFLDYASGGLVVTTADDKMSMYAGKNFNNLVPFDGSSGSWTIPFYLGNIWFLGIMQK